MSSLDPYPLVNSLSQRPRMHCNTGSDSTNVSMSTFSAMSHLVAHTFGSPIAQCRTVRPRSSQRWGSAPDCSSNWINQFGALLSRANIRGVIPVDGHLLISAPAWSTYVWYDSRMFFGCFTTDWKHVSLKVYDYSFWSWLQSFTIQIILDNLIVGQIWYWKCNFIKMYHNEPLANTVSEHLPITFERE